MELNRRKFLKLSAVGSAGWIIPTAAKATTHNNTEHQELSLKKAETRTLGRTGIKLPVLSMGVMRADNPNLVKAALKAGVVHFDTANGYQEGRNETMLGKIFKEIEREKIVISTKVNLGKELMAPDAPEKFMAYFNQSLERLQMDHVDILYLHAIADVNFAKHPPILEVMKKLKDEGRAKHLGISTHQNEPAVIEAAIEAGIYDVVLTSYNYKQNHLDTLNAAIKKAHDHGIGIVAMKTMAGAKGVNCKAALKWSIQNKHICTAIPGFTTFDQMNENIQATINPKLSKEEKRSLEQKEIAQDLYCRQCNQCSGQCPKALPIPDLMRAYMYSYGYKQPSMSKELVNELAVTENPCGDCSECTVKCVSGFNVAQRIQDISRIKNVPTEFLA